MKVVNLTPHAICVQTEAGDLARFEPSGIVARVVTVRAEVPAVAGFRVVAQDMGDVTGLPPVEAGTIYIVSAMVLSALVLERGQGISSRAGVDVFAPDTGADAIREGGQIVAVRGFVC